MLIANAVRTVSDGQWRTLDARGMYRQAKAAGVEYQTHLRAGLRSTLGVEFGDVDANGQADILGIDEVVLTEFSTRGIDIESEVEAWAAEFIGREGRRPTPVEAGKAHKTITLATRTAKPADAGLATATLRDRWRARADHLVDVDQMLAAVFADPLAPAEVSRPSIDEVLAAVETKHAEWAEPQLIEQIAARVTGPDPATIAAVIEEVRADAMASVGVIDLTPPAEPGDTLRSSDGRPLHLPPSAVRYTTRRHLQRELDIVDWATSTGDGSHRAVDVDARTVEGLDDGQAKAVTAMLTQPRPVITVVGPAGAGKTRMLAASVRAWQKAGVPVFGVGPSASAAKQLQDGAGTVADTLHKLVYEHSTKQATGRGAADLEWMLPAGSVVIVDEAGMVDTALLHRYAQIAQAKNWRTVLVGDHRQLDAVDAGGMFAELVHDPDVATVELDTLHRFEHDWEADASPTLRNRDTTAVAIYDRHGRIHGHHDQAAAIGAVADAAFDGITDGRDVLVMAPTNTIVDALNTALTDRLVDAGWFDPADTIYIGGRVFHPGQPIVTRTNNRQLTYGPGRDEWVRNGDRWTVDAGTRDELYVTSLDNRHRHALPAEYIAAGNVTVDYASTINRAQGATVDEAHVIISERTNTKQLYVGATRGRRANHIHTAPPAFDPEDHNANHRQGDWTPTGAVIEALRREPDDVSAIARRRRLRDLAADPRERERRHHANKAVAVVDPDDAVSERAAVAIRRLQRFRVRRGQSLGR